MWDIIFSVGFLLSDAYNYKGNQPLHCLHHFYGLILLKFELVNAIFHYKLFASILRGRTNLHPQCLPFIQPTFVLICRMHEIGICPTEKKVFFGQLLGMSDPISFTLGKSFSMASTSKPLTILLNFGLISLLNFT